MTPIERLEAASGRITELERQLKVAREAFKRIATVDENGLAEYTPQAMVEQANIALASMEPQGG